MSSQAEKHERRCMAPQMPSEVISQKTYAFIYAPGPQWLVGRPVTEQNLEAHCAYMGDLYARSQVPLGGLFVDDAGGGFALVRAKGRGEAVALLAADPAIREGVFTGVVRRCHALFNGPEEMGAALSQVRSNKRAVRALFEAVDRRDGEGVRAGYDENITIHGRSPAPPVIIPCSAALRRMLDAMDRTSPLILTTKTGQSFKKRYFARLWDE